MNRKLTIAVKEPRKKWELRKVEDRLEVYQDIVGGYIEHCYTTKGGMLIFGNEFGKNGNYAFNILAGDDFLFGTLFAVRSDDEGEFQSLRDEDLKVLGLKKGE